MQQNFSYGGDVLKAEWKAEVVKKMYQYEIKTADLAEEANITAAYLNMILSDARNPEDGEEKITSALNRLLERAKEKDVSA